MKEVTRSRTPVLAGTILIFTAFSQVALSGNITALKASSALFAVLVFAFLLQVVREVVADGELYAAHDKRIKSDTLGFRH